MISQIKDDYWTIVKADKVYLTAAKPFACFRLRPKSELRYGWDMLLEYKYCDKLVINKIVHLYIHSPTILVCPCSVLIHVRYQVHLTQSSKHDTFLTIKWKKASVAVGETEKTLERSSAFQRKTFKEQCKRITSYTETIFTSFIVQVCKIELSKTIFPFVLR